jgi:hypothetical protein
MHVAKIVVSKTEAIPSAGAKGMQIYPRPPIDIAATIRHRF